MFNRVSPEVVLSKKRYIEEVVISLIFTSKKDKFHVCCEISQIISKNESWKEWIECSAAAVNHVVAIASIYGNKNDVNITISTLPTISSDR